MKRERRGAANESSTSGFKNLANFGEFDYVRRGIEALQDVIGAICSEIDNCFLAEILLFC